MQYEIPPYRMMQPHDLTNASQFTTHNLFPIQDNHIKLENDLEHDPSSTNASASAILSNPNNNFNNDYPQTTNLMPNDVPLPPLLTAMQQQIPRPISDYSASADSADELTRAQLQSLQSQDEPSQPTSARTSTGSAGSFLIKAFACSTCSKGFARRSDLARHERIHSGERPHMCDYPGCDKQFIQRSALTVHSRVHTGEKPHMCECCTKNFSDSSSLARHRRIHSGKRPYKCPYNNCQKTFTRRTTLTRHQNHHSGTVEESALVTAAALASREHKRSMRGRNASVVTRDNAAEQTMLGYNDAESVSSESLTAALQGQQRHTPDYYMHALTHGMSNGMTQNIMTGLENGLVSGMGNGMNGVPAHMSQSVSRAVSPLTTQHFMPVSKRSSMTSHPAGFTLPSPLDAAGPTSSHQSSNVQSPAMVGSGWQSPNDPISDFGAYPMTSQQGYPDPSTQQYMQNAQDMYFTRTQAQGATMPLISPDIWMQHA